MSQPSKATLTLNATITSSKVLEKKAREELAAEPKDLAKLESTLKGLQGKLQRLTQAYEEREDEITSGETLSETELGKLMDSQDEILGLLRTVIIMIEKEVSLATVKNEPPVAEIRTKVHAPAIKLLTFDGTTADFAPFWDNFESQIGRRKDIPDVDKLAYLKGQLKGEALSQIKDYPSTAANYEVAVGTLKGHYGDTERIMRDLGKSFMKMEEAKDTPSDVSRVLTLMERTIHGCKNLGVDMKGAEGFIVLLVRSQLSPMTLQLMKSLTDTPCKTIETIRKGIHSAVNHLEESKITEKRHTKVESKVSPNQPKSTKKKSGSNSHWQKSDVGNYIVTANTKPTNAATSSAVSSKTSGSRTTNTWTCRLCAGTHKDAYCDQYASWEARKKRLEEQGRCLRCINKHSGEECQLKVDTCMRCGVGKHHIVLCDATKSASAGNTTTAVPVAVESELPSQMRTPLLTAMVTVSSAGQEVPVRMFLDTGAQQPLLHAKVAKDLKLKPIKQVEMTIRGIHGMKIKKKYDLVKVTVACGSDVRDIDAVVFDRLPNISTAGLANAVKHLEDRGVPLANPDIVSDEITDIGLLVGNGYFQEVVDGKKRIDGMILRESPAGLMLGSVIPQSYVSENSQVENSPNTSVLIARMNVAYNPIEVNTTEDEIKSKLGEEAQLPKLQQLESIGITKEEYTPEETSAYDSCTQSVKNSNDQHCFQLPFKANIPLQEWCTNSSELQGELAARGYKWKFIEPKSPWPGDFYERLIGLTKSCLKKALFRKKVSIEDLRTVLKEVQCRLNNRPITYMSDDINDLEALTPSHLICGRRIRTMPSVSRSKEE